MNIRNTFSTPVVIACLIFGAGSAMAGAVTSGKIPFEMEVVTCHETVSLSGWYRATTNFQEDGAGGTHDISHLVAHGTGTGQLTGTRYVWNDQFNHQALNDTNGAFSGNRVLRTNLVIKGNLENSKIWLNLHLTITPDGTAVVDRSRLIFECL